MLDGGRRMKLAHQLRWKNIKQGSEPPQAEAAKPKKRRMSAARSENDFFSSEEEMEGHQSCKESSVGSHSWR
jgi:hypothetical protein